MRMVFSFLCILLFSMSIFAKEGWKTEVYVFKPEVKSLSRLTKNGSCFASSIATSRSDAYRCMVGNSIFDPCFVTDKKDVFICDADPAQGKKGFLLKTKKTFTEKNHVGEGGSDIWIIKLENGEICYPYTGTMPILKKNDKILALRYGCVCKEKGVMSGLLDESLVPGKIWKARRVIYKKEGSEQKALKIQDVKIRKVWK